MNEVFDQQCDTQGNYPQARWAGRTAFLPSEVRSWFKIISKFSDKPYAYAMWQIERTIVIQQCAFCQDAQARWQQHDNWLLYSFSDEILCRSDVTSPEWLIFVSKTFLKQFIGECRFPMPVSRMLSISLNDSNSPLLVSSVLIKN